MGKQTVTLPVASLEVCDRVRVRVQKPKIDSDVVQEYAEAYQAGLMVAPLDVFQEKGTERYIISDGEHRWLAAIRAKQKSIDVRLHQGDEVAALDFAIGCNHAHGLRRSRADKYRALVRILETPALADKYRTDADLSDKVGIAIRTVQAYRAEWRNSSGGSSGARRRKKKAAERAGKHTAPERKPKTQDELDAEQAQQAIDTVRLFPYDGAEAARRWGKSISVAQARLVRDFWQEYVAALEA